MARRIAALAVIGLVASSELPRDDRSSSSERPATDRGREVAHEHPPLRAATDRGRDAAPPLRAFAIHRRNPPRGGNATRCLGHLKTCALKPATLSEELRRRGSRCHAFAPLGRRLAEESPFERRVCLRSLTQSGSTWAEAVVIELMRRTCAAVASCSFESPERGARQEDPSDPVPARVRVSWPGGAIRFATEGVCLKHQPLAQDRPDLGNLVLIRDPRHRRSSHVLYRRQVKGGRMVVSPRTVQQTVVKDVESLRNLWVGGYDAGGQASALPVRSARPGRDHSRQRRSPRGVDAPRGRYELLSDPILGVRILQSVDDYLGLPRLRGTPLDDGTAGEVLALQSYDYLRLVCWDHATGKWNASQPDCPATDLQLFRTHEPKTMRVPVRGSRAGRGDAVASASRRRRGDDAEIKARHG